MDEKDFKDLYDLMRGNPDAMAVLDIQSLFQLREYQQAAEKLQAIRERYYASKFRALRIEVPKDGKGRSKQEQEGDRRTLRKQNKYREVLEKIDELLAGLDPIVKRAIAKSRRDRPAADDDSGSEHGLSDDGHDIHAGNSEENDHVFDQFATDFHAADATEQNAVIERYFSVGQVSSATDIVAGDLYLIDGGSKTFLAAVEGISPPDSVALRSPIDNKRLKSLDRETFIRLGNANRIVHLVARQQRDATDQASQLGQSASLDDDEDEVISSAGAMGRDSELQESATTARILDKGAFSQLADALQRCGIGSGTEIIIHVRDREFRRGDFQEALQALEGVYGKFSASIASRAARIRQEDLNIQAGKVKMSPKEIQAKRVRDNAQNQLIDRARTRFSRVLDGLRVLLRTNPSA